MTRSEPLRVRVTGRDSESAAGPNARYTPASAARRWQHALSLDPAFVLDDGPGALVLRFVEPEDLPDVRAGEVGVVDWPREVLPQPIRQGVRGIVTHSQSGAHSLSIVVQGQVPVVAIPVPCPEPPGPIESASPALYFDGWLFDSWHPRRGGVAAHRIQLDPASRVVTIVADARDADRSWMDAVFAVTESFRERSDQVLIVWLTHPNPAMGSAVMGDIVYRSMPYACRVIAGVGQMSDANYEALIRHTDVVVAGNDSDVGLRPLVDFMSRGVLAIGSPAAHPGLLTAENCLTAVSYDEAAVSWIADEPLLTRIRSRYDWPTLVTALQRYAQLEPATAGPVARAGAASAHRFCDSTRATEGLAALVAPR